MAKNKAKKAEVEIIDLSKNSSDLTQLEVVVNGQSIGKVEELDNHFYLASYQNGDVRKVRTMDEAVEYLLMTYNLHDMK